MFQIYLPLAEMSISAPLLLLLGGGVGILSGLFGISGGFLVTPLLMFIGIPSAIAVGTQANQAVASASAGMLSHRTRRNVDIRLGLVMLVGSVMGTSVGSSIFGWLQATGLIDFVIALLYVIFLTVIGGVMLWESSRILLKRNQTGYAIRREVPRILGYLPFKHVFPASGLEISLLVPIGIGFIAGVTTVLMGLGGTLLVPAMIYLLAMPPAMVAGTSLFQVVFTSGAATMLHAVSHQTVDIMLALPLMVGSVMGAQIGARFATRVRPEVARCILALIILAVSLRLVVQLTLAPAMPFSWEMAP